MKKILISISVISMVAAASYGATRAFFSSTATATGNTFTAGTLNLLISKDNGSNSSDGSWQASQNAAWNFSAMVPGGAPSVSKVWLENSGSVNGLHFGVSAANSESVGGYEKQVRITSLTLGGSNLLSGGAGATIGAYAVPTNCTYTMGGSDKLTTVIAAAHAGDVICATGSNYSAAWEGVSVIPVTVSGITIQSVGGPSATASIPFDVTGSNVTIRGFSISDPSAGYAVNIHGGAHDVTVSDNVIHDIGTSLASGSVQAISVQNGALGGSHYTFSGNRIYNVGNLSLVYGSSGSAKGIYLGDTGASGALDYVTITNNIISHVQAATAAWTAGRGAYGILTNVHAGVTHLVIQNNTITDLEGLWSHAVGLEGVTPGASVTYNDISGLVDHKGNTDSVGVRFEDNASAGTVYVNNNNFALSMKYGISNVTGIDVNGTSNWWGDFTPASHVDAHVNYASPAGGPLAGFVNGTDQNGNGYADLQDLRLTPIVNAPVGLNAGEQKQLVMGVQLDGPTTGNNYQGATLNTVLTFDLAQQ